MTSTTSLGEEQKPPYTPTFVAEASLKYVVPVTIAQRFRQFGGVFQYQLEIVLVACLLCFAFEKVYVANRDFFVLLQTVLLLGIVYAKSKHAATWIARVRCKRALRNAQPDQSACAINYGVPGLVFDEGRPYWDVGLFRADGGFQFEGERHSFSLTASQIAQASVKSRSILGGQQILEISWRTPSGALSSVFVCDSGANKVSLNFNHLISKICVGSRPCGPLPIDCSTFPPVPKAQGWGLVALGSGLGFAAAAFPLMSHSDSIKGEVGSYIAAGLCITLGVLGGRYWQQMLTNHRVAKLAIVEPTE